MNGKIVLLAALILIVYGCIAIDGKGEALGKQDLPKFGSCAEFDSFMEKAQSRYYVTEGLLKTEVMPGVALGSAMEAGAPADYSGTNVQVEGVDEADIVKTDGRYIYAVSGSSVIIAEAYPIEDARIVSTIKLDYAPKEIFIGEGKLIVFGQYYGKIPTSGYSGEYGYHGYRFARLGVYDLSDIQNPKLVKTADFEGSYLSSRKVGEYAYFVITNHQRHVPLYAEGGAEYENISGCEEISRLPDSESADILIIGSLSLADAVPEIKKETIVGSAENVYASMQNLYVAERNPSDWGSLDFEEKTAVHKFSFSGGVVSYAGSGEVPGTVLNQFSMDEYGGHFRIATTRGRVWNSENPSTNNLYVLGENLKIKGSLEGLAPGEKIYSVRFMGGRAYMVTFKKIDPLFVLDLSEPSNPKLLGKLKIPGYSDYLHPMDENHLIGIGKDTAEAEEGDFAWYQGLKMAVFDVSDLEHPKEEHKIVIGDRGTDSYALHDHKAFLYDKDRELLVIPVLLAEREEGARPNAHGDYVFQGAYVFRLTPENGFELRGRITHYESDDVFAKSGYYFRGDSDIKRSLYIKDVLYTVSEAKIAAHDFRSLGLLKELPLKERGIEPDGEREKGIKEGG